MDGGADGEVINVGSLDNTDILALAKEVRDAILKIFQSSSSTTTKATPNTPI
jgi:hypothetical protein